MNQTFSAQLPHQALYYCQQLKSYDQINFGIHLSSVEHRSNYHVQSFQEQLCLFLNFLNDQRVSALATAHLFNFVGDGLLRTREILLRENHLLPSWQPEEIMQMKGSLAR